MKFTDLTQKTHRGFGTAFLNLALLTGSLAASGASGTYYSRRGGSYTRRNQSYLTERGVGNFSKKQLTRKEVVTSERAVEIPSGDIRVAKGAVVRELIIVDQNVKDYRLFSRLSRAGVEVVEIPKDAGGLDFLLNTLSQYEGLTAVHLMSHATSGKLTLGNEQVSSATLKKNLQALEILNKAVVPGGDFLLYGCELAKGDEGDDFLEIIKGNTHVDVAASNDLTGNADFNGDWDLEITKGDIEASPIEGSIALKDLSGVLQTTFDFESGVVSGLETNHVTQYFGGYTLNVYSTPGGIGKSSTYYSGGTIGTESLISYYSGQNTNLYFYLSGAYTFNFNSAEFIGLYIGGQTIRLSTTKGYVDFTLGYHSSYSFNVSNLTLAEQDYFKNISEVEIKTSPDGPVEFLIDNFNVSNISIDDVPILNTISILSNNLQPAYAKVGDQVTVSFTASEDIQTPLVYIIGKPTTPTGSGTTWDASYTLTGSDTEGNISFSISFTDFSGNSGSPAVSTTDATTVIFDKTAPTMTGVTMASDNLNNSTYGIAGNTVTITIDAVENISEPVVTILGNNAFVTGADKDWTATYVLSGSESDGPVSFNIGFSDIAGNAGTDVTQTTDDIYVDVDNTIPSGYSITIDQAAINSANQTVTSFTFSGAELSTTYDYVISSSGGGTPIIGSGSIEQVNQQVEGISVASLFEGTLTYSVTLTDEYGNIGAPSQPTVAFDVTSPSATGGTTSPNVLEGDSYVTALPPSEILATFTVIGTDASFFTADASTGQVEFISAPDFENPLDGDANNVYQFSLEMVDLVGNNTLFSMSVTVTDKADEIAPVITGPSGGAGASTSAISVAENTTFVHTFTADETVNWLLNRGEDEDYFTINSSTGVLSFISGRDFENPLDGSIGGTNTYEVIIGASDASSNYSEQTVTVTITDVDEIPPSITGPSGGAGATTSAISIAENTTAVHTFTASETVTWSLNGGEDVLRFAIAGASGVLTFTTAQDFEIPTDGATSGSNTYLVNVSATDGLGNASSQTVTVTVTNTNDNAPSIQTPGIVNLTENSIVGTTVVTMTATDLDGATTFTWSLDETSMTDVDADGQRAFVINSSTGVITVNDSGDLDFETNPSFSPYVIVGDGANATGTNISVTILNADEIAPTVVISTSVTTPTSSLSIPVTFTFNEQVTGFALTDVTITGGALSGLGTTDNITFTATLTPSITTGDASMQVAAGSYTDQAGNAGLASANFLIAIDQVAPTAAVSTSATNPTNMPSIPITVTFSEAVSGLELTDFVPVNAAVSNLGGGGTTYALNLNPAADGLVSLSISAAAVTDNAGNASTAVNFSITSDRTVPLVVMASALTTPTKNSSVPVTITFNESVSGLELTDFQVSNGSLNTLSGTGTSYSVNLVASAEGPVSLNLPVNSAQDVAGNGNNVSNNYQHVYDLTAPVVTVTALQTVDDTPPLSGTVNDPLASVSVTVNGQTVSASVTGTSWSVANNVINSLATGIYDVVATVTDQAGNAAADNTTNELQILGGPPEATAATAIAYFSFTVNWSARAGVSSYQLDVASDASFTNLLAGFNNLSTTQTSVNVNSGVYYGSAYYYRVRAVYPGNVVSVNSNSVQVITPIDPNTVADSVALLTIYDALGGANWTRKSNWRSNQPLRNWTDITFPLTGTRVTAINLSSNNLRGSLPNWGTGLESVTTFNLRTNRITTIPSNLGSFANTQFDLRNNRLQFGTLEPVASLTTLQFNPQDSVGTQIITLQQQGTTYTLDRTITGSNNVYTWFKLATGTSTPTQLTGTGPTRSLNITAFSDEGKYFATVTNSAVTGLTLTTHAIEIRVSSLQRDQLALRAIYTALGGANWTGDARVWGTLGDLTNSANRAAWQTAGVTVANERVTQVNISSNGISGAMPIDLTDIRGLTTVNLSGNAITSIPDMTVLANLTSLNVSSNNLEFGDLEKNITVPGFQYANQARAGTSRQDTVAVNTAQTVSIQTTGENNTYQWYFTDVIDNVEMLIQGATSTSYEIPSIEYESMGLYRVRMTNTKVPNITIEGRRQVVLAYGEIRFKGIGEGDLPITEGTGYALKNQGQGRPFDSAAVAKPVNEEFFFGKLVLGDYLVAIEGDTSKYLPTYYRNTFLWEEADTLELRDNLNEVLHLIQKPPILPPGIETQVAGFVEADLPDDPDEEDRILARRKVQKAGCSMRKFKGSGRTGQDEDQWELIAYVQTNDEGQFVFDYLPSGLYRFNIEYPGIPMDPNSFVEFEIIEGEEDASMFVLEAFVTENGIEVERVEPLGFRRNYFKNLEVYPNPADNFIKLSYAKLLADEVYVELIDMTGKVLTKQILSRGYNLEYELNAEMIPNGFYVLNFVDTSKADKIVKTVKVVVKHN